MRRGSDTIGNGAVFAMSNNGTATDIDVTAGTTVYYRLIAFDGSYLYSTPVDYAVTP